MIFPQETLDGELREAVRKGRVEKMDWLLGAGADPNGREVLGVTMLHEAARYGQRAAAELLLKKGADPTVREHPWHKNGGTPDMTAETYGPPELAQLLRGLGKTGKPIERQGTSQSPTSGHAAKVSRSSDETKARDGGERGR